MELCRNLKHTVPRLLDPLVFRKSFEDGGGDGSIVGRSGEVATGGEDGLNAAKCAKQDVDEDLIVAF